VLVRRREVPPDRKQKQKGAALGMDYRIVDVRGHVEVYDSQGQFLFSADTEEEALADLAG